MASNCPYWKNSKCAGTANDYYHPCGLDAPEYEACPLYKMIKVKSAGGTTEDMLRGADLIGGARFVGGRGHRIYDQELDSIIKRNPTTSKRKKWWEFWKKESIDKGLSNSVNELYESTRKKGLSGKVKKCLNCGSEIPNGLLQCSGCGSQHFIWD